MVTEDGWRRAKEAAGWQAGPLLGAPAEPLQAFERLRLSRRQSKTFFVVGNGFVALTEFFVNATANAIGRHNIRHQLDGFIGIRERLGILAGPEIGRGATKTQERHIGRRGNRRGIISDCVIDLAAIEVNFGSPETGREIFRMALDGFGAIGSRVVRSAERDINFGPAVIGRDKIRIERERLSEVGDGFIVITFFSRRRCRDSERRRAPGKAMERRHECAEKMFAQSRSPCRSDAGDRGAAQIAGGPGA